LIPKENMEDALRESVSSFYSQTSNWDMFRFTEPLFQIIPSHLMGKIKDAYEITSA